MSRRYTGRRWTLDPLQLRGQLFGCKTRLRELLAERRNLADRVIDLEGANATLITEVNTLREIVRVAQASRNNLQAELAVARAINVNQARTIAHQGTELVRCTEALGSVLSGGGTT